MNKSFFPLINEDELKLPFVLESIGVQEKQEHVIRKDGYPNYHWIHCVKGKGLLVMHGTEFIIDKNMGFFIYPGTPHEYYSLEEPWETHWITFTGYAVPPLLNLVGLNESKAFYFQDLHLIEDCFTQLLSSISMEIPMIGFNSSLLLYKFLILCRSNISNSNRLKPTKEKQLAPVISFLEDNYTSNPSLEEMSVIIEVTPQHLCRLFKETFNLRPFAFLTKIRIQKSKELMMSESNISIKDIASKIGYNDASYFCSLFKGYEGVTPTEFRKIYRKK